MRKVKTIKIDDKEVTLKELRVKDIRAILDSTKAGDIGSIEASLPLITGLDAEALNELAPSELKILMEAAREVNADFLAGLDMIGVVSTIKSLIQKNLTVLQAA